VEVDGTSVGMAALWEMETAFLRLVGRPVGRERFEGSTTQ